jgi:hypothetical protein
MVPITVRQGFLLLRENRYPVVTRSINSSNLATFVNPMPMNQQTLLSLVESPMHPDFSTVYNRLNIKDKRVTSLRSAVSQLKQFQPDFVVAEFFYGYSNNYAGVNISNLDVFLFSLQKFAPQTRVIVMVNKSEYQYVGKLNEIFPLFAVLQHPVAETTIESLLANVD